MVEVSSTKVYGDGQSHICRGAVRCYRSDVCRVQCPEVCSAHAKPEVTQYPP